MNTQEAIRDVEQLIVLIKHDIDHSQFMVKSSFGLVKEMWAKRVVKMREELAEKEFRLKELTEEV